MKFFFYVFFISCCPFYFLFGWLSMSVTFLITSILKLYDPLMLRLLQLQIGIMLNFIVI